jgi:hypothetical protein
MNSGLAADAADLVGLSVVVGRNSFDALPGPEARSYVVNLLILQRFRRHGCLGNERKQRGGKIHKNFVVWLVTEVEF